MHINARVPVNEYPEGTFHVLVVGEQEAALGEMVTITETKTKRQIKDVFVQEVMECAADELTTDYVDLFGFYNRQDLVDGLSKFYGTGLPKDVKVTIYTVGDLPKWVDELEDEDDVEEEEDVLPPVKEDKKRNRWLD